MSFINEAKYRISQNPTPTFFKKLQRVAAVIITTGLSVAFIPGALVYGLCTIGIGLGAAVTAEFATNDSTAYVKDKVRIEEVKKAEEKLKEVTIKKDEI